MGGKVSYVCQEKEEAVDPAQFPEVLDYKTGLHSKGKVIRNESFKCGAGRQLWGQGFKDPSWKGRGVGELEEKAKSVDLETEDRVSIHSMESYTPLQNVFWFN